jgi:hypothetical protein
MLKSSNTVSEKQYVVFRVKRTWLLHKTACFLGENKKDNKHFT